MGRNFYIVLLTDRLRLGAPQRGLGAGDRGHLRAVDEDELLLRWTSRRQAAAAAARYCKRCPRWRPSVVVDGDFLAGLGRAIVAAYGGSKRR